MRALAPCQYWLHVGMRVTSVRVCEDDRSSHVQCQLSVSVGSNDDRHGHHHTHAPSLISTRVLTVAWSGSALVVVGRTLNVYLSRASEPRFA